MHDAGSTRAMRKYGLVKIASPLMDLLQTGLVTAGTGFGMHAGVNALYKLFNRSRAGHQFGVNQMATGLRHGLTGKQLNPVVQAVANYGLGPESLAHYQAAKLLGAQLKNVPSTEQQQLLQNASNVLLNSQNLKNAPLAGHLGPAIEAVRAGGKNFLDRLPTQAEGLKPTLGQRALTTGLGAAAIAAEPHTAIHMGINGMRKGLANSSVGKRFMATQFKRGLSGQSVPPALSAAADILVSPAALDSRRLGLAVNQEVGPVRDLLSKFLRPR